LKVAELPTRDFINALRVEMTLLYPQDTHAKIFLVLRTKDERLVRNDTNRNDPQVVLGDTYDPSLIIPLGEECDVLVHESTFLDYAEARSKDHSTASTEQEWMISLILGMAGSIAQQMKAKSLILTHFSSKFQLPVETQTIPTKHTRATWSRCIRKPERPTKTAFY
jgi:ribonuclease BN (tRNA processing enzyme)